MGASGGCVAWLLRYTFVALFFLLGLPAWIYVAAVDACGFCCGRCCGRCCVASPRTTKRLLRLGFRLLFCISCWLHFHTAVRDDMRKAGDSGRPVCMLLNHSSMLDTPLSQILPPWKIARNMKALASHNVFKMPLIGRLVRAGGNFPVYFKSDEEGRFEVDKERMAEVTVRLDQHVEGGGHLVVFPEGHLNKEWQKIADLRVGGFEICIRHDMEIWSVVMTGNAQSWPLDAPGPGAAPARLRSRAVLLHSSAREAAEALAPGLDRRAQAVALAASCREGMQRLLDEMCAASDTAAGRKVAPDPELT